MSETVIKGESYWSIAWRRLRRDRLTAAAFVVLFFIALSALLAGVITSTMGIDPNDIDLFSTFEGISAEHILGTDQLGRDQFARLLHGGRVSLSIGTFGTLVALVLALIVGTMAGYFGGRVDDVIMWLINTIDAIPGLFLLLFIASLFTLNPVTLVLLFGALGWIYPARIVRGQTLALKERDFIMSGVAAGGNPFWIIWHHILPNIIPLLIIVTVRSIGILILSESALSYLGLGVVPPTPTWGNMLSKSQQSFHLGLHLVIFPGLCITLTVLCLYIIGDGLRDALDPGLERN